jgi:hypothetical protein
MALVLLLPAVLRADDGKTFPLRVDYAPLVAKLHASGGDPSRIIVVERPADLSRLDPGKRYKFALAGKFLTIAPLPADAPSNEYVHPILAGGAPVSTAGGIVVEKTPLKITLDQDSKAYCPTFESLDRAARALIAAGVPGPAIDKRNRPPDCAPPK